ncbi:MAG: acyltransferase, partial [Firmicutes bacterium]|nr:acyltransferase [Bacillota bacterium]
MGDTINKRSGNVDIAKFIAAMIIMTHHLYIIGASDNPYHDGWVYVEFFFMVTGYYTARHFSGREIANRPKEAFSYTIKKILPMFPYALAVTLCAYFTQAAAGLVFNGWTWREFLINFMGDFTFDVLLLTDTFTNFMVVPLWYISALLIVFPFFCLLAQLKNRYTKVLVCLVYPLMYFGWLGVTGNRTFPRDMLRAMAGMMLGLVVYEFSVIFKAGIERIPKGWLTLIELVTFVYPVFCGYMNYCEEGYTSTRLFVYCFFVSLLLCLPGYSHTAKIKGKFFNYLGRLSIPVFILHWYVGSIINGFSHMFGWELDTKIAVYYAVALAGAALLMFIIEHLRTWTEFLKKDIFLIDCQRKIPERKG